MKKNSYKKDIYENQINKLKESGITFKQITVDEAITYLRDKTYLFRLKCYLNNYEKKDGKYNIDFLELIEISTLDFHLRKLILAIMIDIEHIIKVNLINSYDDNKIENINIKIKEFIKERESCFLRNRKINYSDYKYDLYNKYEEEWKLWAFVETLSFGSLEPFIKFLKVEIPYFKGLYFSLKTIRNAAAHNSLLLCNLKNNNENFNFTNKVKDFLLKNKFTTEERKILLIPFINDFMCMMLIMYRFSDNTVISCRIKDLIKFFDRVKSKDIITSEKLINIFNLINKFHNILINKNKK